MRRADSIASTSRSKEISFSRTKPRRALMSMSTATPPLPSRRVFSLSLRLNSTCTRALSMSAKASLRAVALRPFTPGTSRSRPSSSTSRIRATSSSPPSGQLELHQPVDGAHVVAVLLERALGARGADLEGVLALAHRVASRRASPRARGSHRRSGPGRRRCRSRRRRAAHACVRPSPLRSLRDPGPGS